MKRIIVVITFIFLSLFVFGFVKVHADEPTITITNGASIRTVAPAGLKFEATVSGDIGEGTISYGFLLARGELTKSDMISSYGKGKAVAVNCGEPDENNKIYITIVNIPAEGYYGDITALAYIGINGVPTYLSEVVTRNIYEVAVNTMSDPKYASDAFIKRIVNTSSLVLNGGSFVYNYKFTISGDGDAGSNVALGYTLNIASKENYSNAATSFFTRLYLEKDDATGYYRIIAKGDAPAEYDYVIAVHGNCTDLASKTAFSNLATDPNREDYYLKIDIPEVHTSECNIEVIVGSNSDIIRGTKVYFAANETLPTLSKDYYDFDGWCLDSGLGDAPLTQHPNEEGAKTYYAKFTPTDYTIQFDLQGGKTSGNSSMDDVVYNVTSADINLPLPGTMTITDGTFKGWYTNSTGNGDSITSIPNGSHGDMTIYACWNMNVHTAIDINEDDKEALEALTADIIVYPTARALDGSYYLQYSSTKLAGDYSEKEFEYGSDAFASIADALNYIDENNLTGKKVYIFAGTYSDELDLTEANTTLYGPSYTKAYDDRASSEAIISELTTISANGATIRGIKFTTNGNIKVSANNATISHCYIAPSKTLKCYGGNRQGCIADGVAISGLTIEDSYICAPGASQSYTTQFASFTDVTNLAIRDCYITNSATTFSNLYAGMMIYTPRGTITIEDNEFHWPTDGYVLYIGQAGNQTTSISIQRNLFTGSATKNSATIRISFGKTTTTTNIIENRFVNFLPSTFNFNSDAGSTVNIKYNYFDSQQEYRVSNIGSAKINFDYNFFEGGIGGTDVSGAATKGHRLSSSSELYFCINRYHTPVVSSVSYSLEEGATHSINEIDNYNEGVATSLTNIVPTKPGYLFLGWTFEAESDDYITEIPCTKQGNITLHAHFALINQIELGDSQVSFINSNTPTIIVKSDLSSTYYSLDNDDLSEAMKAKVYTKDVDAFTTISAAITAASEGDVIYVFDGTYSNNFTIGTNNITLIGPNYNVSGDSLSRNSEANITGNITLTAGLENTTIRGFKFSGTSKIINIAGVAPASGTATNLNNFTFSYNKVESGIASGNGFIYFVESANSYSHNINISHN